MITVRQDMKKVRIALPVLWGMQELHATRVILAMTVLHAILVFQTITEVVERLARYVQLIALLAMMLLIAQVVSWDTQELPAAAA